MNGDFNDLLDRDLNHAPSLPKSVLIQGKGCNSTNHSSTNKSPLAAYTNSVDLY